MANNITPVLGVDLTFNAATAYDGKTPTPEIGTVVKGDDGHDYVFALSSATVASSGTAVVLTEPAMTFAAGAGAWTTVVANATTGNYCWLKRTAI